MAQVAKAALKAAQTPVPPPEPPRSEDNPLLFTPIPDSGFPPVHGYTSTRIFDNLDHEQRSVWLSLESAHVFVQPLYHGYYPPDVAPEMVHLIRETIQLALGPMQTKVKVTAPSPHSQVNRLDKPPFTYLVRGVTNEEATRLVNQYCLACKSLGLLIFKAGIQAPTYLGSIAGLTIYDEDDHISVLTLVPETFISGPVGTIIAEISAAHPDLQMHKTERRTCLRHPANTCGPRNSS